MRRTIAFLFVVMWTTALRCQGYDYSSTCTRPYRSSRVKSLPPAPCDLSKQNYCSTPGKSYPWHAIRRFVRENQGLMRRMYGEEPHSSILKAELENFVDDEDEQNENVKTGEFVDDILKAKIMYTKNNHKRAMKTRPHFRPIQTTPSSIDKTKKFGNDTLRGKPLSFTRNNTKANHTKSSDISNETVNDDQNISYKTKLESIANVEVNHLDPDVITLEAVINQSIETNSIYPKHSVSTQSDRGEPNVNNESTSINNVTSSTESIVNITESSIKVEPVNYSTTESTKNTWKLINTDTSTLPPTLLFSQHDKINKNDKVEGSVNEKKEEFNQRPHHPESYKPSVIKLEGANACQTKEEMAAPFWANSTRGEVLALLNMYPFEQYIHLETCVHEKKQMYCREGCRCEQQFRFHRLLAYDPRNECRGIFAEWFRFPACCVCKCYDIPIEFRARSPRILPPDYGEDVKRAIYEDVARDWYSVSSYDDEEF